MIIRQRAMAPGDKEARREAILDAAQSLLLRVPEHAASMADVALEAGLAKGTVYLYFRSKDDLLLAMHERGIERYFRAVDALLAGTQRVTIDDMLTLIRRHLVEPPLFLPMASRCLAMMRSTPGRGIAFHRRMAERTERAGAGLERHFAELRQGDGSALVRRSYALIVGLWQMSLSRGAEGERTAMAAGGAAAAFAWSYPREIDRALRALWHGSLNSPEPR